MNALAFQELEMKERSGKCYSTGTFKIIKMNKEKKDSTELLGKRSLGLNITFTWCSSHIHQLRTDARVWLLLGPPAIKGVCVKKEGLTCCKEQHYPLCRNQILNLGFKKL